MRWPPTATHHLPPHLPPTLTSHDCLWGTNVISEGDVVWNFKTGALFLSTFRFFQNPLFITLSYIIYVTRGQGGGGVVFFHLVVSTSAYIFSLGSFQHLLLSSSALTRSASHPPRSSSSLRGFAPASRPAAWLQMCQAKFNICSMLPCPSNRGLASQTKTWL